MYAAPAVPVVLTVVFALTGLVSLVEYARVVASPRLAGVAHAHVEGRAVAVLHLLMSVAMIAMAWGLSGGPTTASGTVQLAVFGGFALGFALAATVPTAARLPRLFHALMALAMVWMVAAMPALMGSAAGAGAGADGADDMAGMPGMSHAAGAAPGAGPTAVAAAPGWVANLTGLLVAVLGVAAAMWLVAVVRSAATTRPAGVTGPAGTVVATVLGRASTPAPGSARPTPAWSEPSAAPSTPSTPSTAVSALSTAVGAPRTGAHHHRAATACCHVLMSGGMAAMLATML